MKVGFCHIFALFKKADFADFSYPEWGLSRDHTDKRRKVKKGYKLAEEPKVTIWCQTDWFMEKRKSSTMYYLHEVVRNVEEERESDSD